MIQRKCWSSGLLISYSNFGLRVMLFEAKHVDYQSVILLIPASIYQVATTPSASNPTRYSGHKLPFSQLAIDWILVLGQVVLGSTLSFCAGIEPVH